MNRRRLSFVFKVTTTVCCLIGILSSLIRTTSITSLLSFYTMQSNLFVLAFYIYFFISRKSNPNIQTSRVYSIFKGATVMVIFLTFIVYNISLQPLGFIMDVKTASSASFFRLSNIFIHFITPIMVILDYLIFDEKGKFKKCYIPAWLLFPALYPVYVYSYAHLGGRFFGIGGSKKYAYFFLDIDKIGINGVIMYLALFTLFYIIACLILIRVDKTLENKRLHKINP